MLPRLGTWLMAVASAVGLIIAAVAYLRRGSGIDYTAGALLVVASTALLLAAALILALSRRTPGWLRGLILFACLLDVLGTAAAAYFLHAWLLLALIVIAGLGWLAAVSRPGRTHLSGAAA